MYICQAAEVNERCRVNMLLLGIDFSNSGTLLNNGTRCAIRPKQKVENKLKNAIFEVNLKSHVNFANKEHCCSNLCKPSPSVGYFFFFNF